MNSNFLSFDNLEKKIYQNINININNFYLKKN